MEQDNIQIVHTTEIISLSFSYPVLANVIKYVVHDKFFNTLEEAEKYISKLKYNNIFDDLIK